MSMKHAVRAWLITNPRGGRGEIDLEAILPVFAAHGWDVTVHQKMHGGHATELAQEAAEDGCDVVIAAGGDGTVGEVVDGLIGTNVAVGVLPGGTANLWAHEIGVSMDLTRATQQMIGAQRRRIDVGHIAINGKSAQHFLLMAGLGIDAMVVSELNKDHKRRFGMLAYLPAIGRALPQSTSYPVQVDLDGVMWQGDVAQIVVGNTRKYASVTSVTPDAYVDDGRLDVALIAPNGPVSSSRQLVTLLTRKHPAEASAVTDRVGRLTIRSSAIIPLEADGGQVKQKKAEVTDEGISYEFSVLAQDLTVLVPRDYTGVLFQTGVVAALPRQADHTGKDKASKRWFRVVAVGVDSITVARVRDGRVFSIVLNPETTAIDVGGEEVPLSAFLSSLGEGQLIHVRGEKQGKQNEIIAERLKMGAP